jgi:hypothetical protein
MQKIKDLLKSKPMYIGLFVGLLLAIAYGSKLPGFLRKVAGYLPSSDTKGA